MATPMIEQEVGEFHLPGAVDLLVYPTGKFKTSLVNILFHRPLDEGAAAAALVPFVLRRGTRRWPDMVAISRHLEMLFGASLDGDVTRFGERQVLSFRMDVVEDRYLFMGGRDLLRQGMEFLQEMLLRPALKGDCFSEDVVAQERLNMRRFVDGLVEDRGRHAFDRCVAHMCEGEPYARQEYGAAKEIERLTRATVTAAWREMLETAPMEIYVVGSTEPERVRELCTDLFGGLRSGTAVGALPTATHRTVRRIRRVEETADLTQARLVMGYRTSVGIDDPLGTALMVWNTMFGSGPFSRLFREVRERHSLAYDCSSSVHRLKGVVFVQAGIDEEVAPQVERIVARQLSEMRRGKMELKELQAAKAHLKASVRATGDSPGRIAGFLQERRVLGGCRSFAEAIARIDRVRRSDVARAAETVKLDTVYLLRRERP